MHTPDRATVWIAVLGAAFSVLLAGAMVGAAAVCANGACHGLTNPAPASARFELQPRQTGVGVEAPVTPGRPPTATPAR